MTRLYEEIDDDQNAFMNLQIDHDGEEEIISVVLSKTKAYRKKYADKYKLERQEKKQAQEEVKREYETNARFDMLAHSAARAAELKLLEVVEYETYVEGTKVMCVFYIKVPDTPVAVLEIPDFEKHERDYYKTELAKQICKTIRGKNEK